MVIERMETKYFKDYRHNYAILKCKDSEDERGYQYRMLASGRIEKLLKCSIRNVNGDSYFYYDISSKVSLENLYRGKKITYEAAKDFFCQMDMVYRNLGRFFMEETGLLIRPENIYYDLTCGEYLGVYYPGADPEQDNSYEALMDFLIEHIDGKDRKLTDIVYRIYEMADEKCFSMADALDLFTEEGDVVVSKCIAADEKAAECEKPFSQEYEGRGYPETAARAEDIYTEDAVMQAGMGTGAEKEVAAKDAENMKSVSPSKRNILFYACFAGLSLGGIGAAAWIYLQFELTQQEFMTILCCMAVMGLCFLFSLIQTVRLLNKNKETEKKDELLKRDIENEFREERPVSLYGVLNRDMDISTAGRSGAEAVSWQDAADVQYSETVFIDVGKQKAEYKLYALDKKNKKHIELTRFPFTIGKMAGCVDCVLADDSISRLHARIEKEDEKIFLTDMNSTNGTYKNGLRMEPSETIEIEPGDEIRFGKLNYCYR